MGAPTIHAMTAFRRVVETRSFKQAATGIGLSGGAVSKLVAQLEADLGTQLLARTTRSLSVTEAGERFYASVVLILDELEQASATARDTARIPSGTLRVSVPTSFALMRLAQRLPDFLVRYPEVALQLNLDDQFVDLVEGGYDCALRIAAQMPDSTLVARRLGSAALVTVAAPRYLRRAAKLARPEDLLAHDCLTHAASGAPTIWTFTDGSGPDRAIEVSGSFRVNNSVMLRHALVSGCGVSLTPSFVVEDLIASGQLVRVLERHPARPLIVYGVTAHVKHLPQKVSAFLEFARQACEEGGAEPVRSRTSPAG